LVIVLVKKKRTGNRLWT